MVLSVLEISDSTGLEIEVRDAKLRFAVGSKPGRRRQSYASGSQTPAKFHLPRSLPVPSTLGLAVRAVLRPQTLNRSSKGGLLDGNNAMIPGMH